MAESSYPFDGQDNYEDNWGAMARLFAPDMVDQEAPGKLGPSTPGGLNSQIAKGRAFVRGFAYLNDATKVFSHDPVATTGQKRIDTIVLRKDTAANTVTAVLIPGTPASSPVSPGMQKDDVAGLWDMPIYDATITAGSNTVVITDRRYLGLPADSKRAANSTYRGTTNNWPASTMGSMGATVLPAAPSGTYLITVSVVAGPLGGDAIGALRVTAQSGGFSINNLTNDCRADARGDSFTPTTWVGTYDHPTGNLDLKASAFLQYAGRTGQVRDNGTVITASLIKSALEEI